MEKKMESKINFESCLNKQAKIVYRETPESPIEIKRGKLVSFDGEFVQLQTDQNLFLINRKHIITLKVFGGGEG
jgi:hypothetical protein